MADSFSKDGGAARHPDGAGEGSEAEGCADEAGEGAGVCPSGQPQTGRSVMTDTRLYAGLSEEEWEAMSAKRQREYEVDDLLNRELGLAEPEVGNDLIAAAAVDLRSRGVLLADASQKQLLDALVRVSS
jgi:hypothetical protein